MRPTTGCTTSRSRIDHEILSVSVKWYSENRLNALIFLQPSTMQYESEMSASKQASYTNNRSPDHMLVLERGLAVIECFDGQGALSVTDVARRTGLSRPAARRCLLTLTTLDYATFDGRLFRLAPRVLKLGFSYLSSTDLPQIIQPMLEQLSATLSESCSAAVLHETDVLYVARVETKRIISTNLRVGSRLPAYCNAMGRVLLASLPEQEARSVLERTDRVKRTQRTLTEIPDLMAELDRVRDHDYSVVHGELESGLLTIAVPIRDSRGNVVAAINVGEHVERTTPEHLVSEVLPRMRALQQQVASLLRG
jgi:IclR family transcriptional regulator, pca regulon regulatory protein